MKKIVEVEPASIPLDNLEGDLQELNLEELMVEPNNTKESTRKGFSQYGNNYTRQRWKQLHKTKWKQLQDKVETTTQDKVETTTQDKVETASQDKLENVRGNEKKR